MIDAPLSASVLQAAPGFMAKEAVINSPISKTIVEHPDTKASFFVPFTKKICILSTDKQSRAPVTVDFSPPC